ncbi:MAG: hypothetical protein QXW65_00195 [Candidatus Pacearchaeota archaeon]
MKALIFDSSAIISLALNDLLYTLEPLKKIFGGDFYLTKTIKEELIDKSLETNRFALEALMIKNLIDKGILTIYPDDSFLEKEKQKILEKANKTFKANNEFVRLIHEGEASCIALYKILRAEKKAIVIDERTTRMLCEAPNNLHRLLEKKLHRKIEAHRENYNFFQNINIIRSSELVLIALNKKIINFDAPKQKIIEAMLYALKFKGCSISNQEIEKIILSAE